MAVLYVIWTRQCLFNQVVSNKSGVILRLRMIVLRAGARGELSAGERTPGRRSCARANLTRSFLTAHA